MIMPGRWEVSIVAAMMVAKADSEEVVTVLTA